MSSHHVVVTRDEKDAVKLYVDGEMIVDVPERPCSVEYWIREPAPPPRRSPGLGPPPRGLLGGGCMLPLLAAAAALLVGCTALPAADPAPSPPSGYALLSYEQIPYAMQGNSHIVVLCDTKRGNLIYLTPGYRENGIAVVPGGCK